jgi:rabankyrin-5
MLPAFNVFPEVRKLQSHLSLLREEYVKLQRRLVEIEKLHQLATAGRSDGNSTDGFVVRLLKIVSDLYGKELYRFVFILVQDL